MIAWSTSSPGISGLARQHSGPSAVPFTFLCLFLTAGWNRGWVRWGSLSAEWRRALGRRASIIAQSPVLATVSCASPPDCFCSRVECVGTASGNHSEASDGVGVSAFFFKDVFQKRANSACVLWAAGKISSSQCNCRWQFNIKTLCNGSCFSSNAVNLVAVTEIRVPRSGFQEAAKVLGSRRVFGLRACLLPFLGPTEPK